eukprot:TRINITY_DN8918_c0_g1_i3.p1 TRINITY_DN8918_c0_g1~~TRINITY_DN8918_c0_g1_i3.p1  ORF type:complete len:495 (+),score=39.74 TRINITY_DN8918_c0_g1_i3:446-1930(+)
MDCRFNSWSPVLKHYLTPYHGKCLIQKFLCAGKEVKPDSIGVRLYICNVQLICDSSKIWGYQGYGFLCKDSKLRCKENSRYIEMDFNSTRAKGLSTIVVSNNCTVYDTACDTADIHAPNSCLSIKRSGFCDNSTVDRVGNVLESVCEKKKNHLMNCSRGLVRCIPEKLLCQGKVVTYSSSSNLGFCESILSVVCSVNGTVYNRFDLGNRTRLCRISQVTCGGVVQPYILQSNLTDCSITSLVCVPLQTSLSCTLHQFGCDACIYNITPSICSDQCIQNVSATICECPVDRTGNDCSGYRSIDCNMSLVYPSNTCGSENTLCNTFHSDSVIKLVYNLSFLFPGFSYDRKEAENRPSFYRYIGDHVAISDSLKWMVQSIFVDFNSFSTWVHETTIETFDENVTIIFNVSEIPHFFWNLTDSLYVEHYVVREGVDNWERPSASLVIILDQGLKSNGYDFFQHFRNNIITYSFLVLTCILVLLCMVNRFKKLKCFKTT